MDSMHNVRLVCGLMLWLILNPVVLAQDQLTLPSTMETPTPTPCIECPKPVRYQAAYPTHIIDNAIKPYVVEARDLAVGIVVILGICLVAIGALAFWRYGRIPRRIVEDGLDNEKGSDVVLEIDDERTTREACPFPLQAQLQEESDTLYIYQIE
jgi:hypothetical protein